MQQTALRKKKVVVLAHSPQSKSVLVVRDAHGKWHLPNTHLHWPIGKKLPQPALAAKFLLLDSTLALVEANDNFSRKNLPSGGFVFIAEPGGLGASLRNVERVSRHLGLEKKVQAHSLSSITEISAHSTYGPDTIESVRCFSDI
jgi:hypothetical protein